MRRRSIIRKSVPVSVGDYVYSDGLYSTILDTNKTVVGVCFYINGLDRRMISLKNMGTHKVQNDIQTFVSNLPEYDTLEDAIRDMDGKRNTQIITNFVMGKGWYSSTYCMYHIAIYSTAGFPAGN